MKIKQDFVTNSSSTSYVVCIPNKFKITTVPQEYINSVMDWEDNEIENEEEYVLQLANKILDLLRSGEVLYFDYEEKIDNKQALREFQSVLPKEMIITSLDVGPEDGKIVCVPISKINKLIKMYGEENETKK